MLEISTEFLDKWHYVNGDVDWDLLVISNSPDDVYFIKQLMLTSTGEINWRMPPEHKKIINRNTIYNQHTFERYRLIDGDGAIAFKEPFQTEAIEIYYFGQANKQHSLLSMLYLSPLVNRRCIESSNCAAIYNRVHIEVGKLKIKHYRVI